MATRIVRARTPGSVNLLGAILVIFAVLAIALRANANSPPNVAEFAPEPQHPVVQAPLEQTSAFGTGEGAAIGPAASPSPSPSPGIPAGAILNRCVGDPPRQIEDPQSPPCIPYWRGDNGGATARGVSSASIKIEIPTDSTLPHTDFEDWKDFFNRRFEFYGRKLTLDFTLRTGTGANDEPTQRADADQVAAAGVFASDVYWQGDGPWYTEELASKGVINTTGQFSSQPSSRYSANAPYSWAYLVDRDTQELDFGAWICARLAGGLAKHAAGTDASVPPQQLATKTRKFGIFQEPAWAQAGFSIQPLLDQLKSCHVEPVVSSPQLAPCNCTSYTPNPSGMANAVLQMRQAGVTTIACVCVYWGTSGYMNAADNQGYYPEWLVDSYGGSDYPFLFKYSPTPPDQLAHLMGITSQPKVASAAEDPAFWAQSEVDPSAAPASSNGKHVAEIMYKALLLIASGIQMAGPQLTPRTFAQGLRRTVFPNPTQPPLFEGHVGFTGGNFGMINDEAEWYWSNVAAGPDAADGGGTLCYVDHGLRHSAGNWPRGGDPFFPSDGYCDSYA